MAHFIKHSLIATCLLAALSFQPTFAQSATLDKIKSTGSITLGYRDSSVPFSYINADGQPTGYAFTICNEVAKAVGAKLGIKDLKVNYQAVTSANRVPLVQNNTVDLECGSTTNSLERQKQVAFSINYFGIEVSAAVWKNSGIQKLDDLNGKTVAVTSGTTAVQLLRDYEKTHNVHFRYLMTKDFAEAMQLVANKRADAFVIDDVLLAGQIANQANPKDFVIIPANLSQEPYAAMMRKGDPEFKSIVDDTIRQMITSGEMAKLYKTWFESPIPPKNVNLNFPMNNYTKSLFKTPTDKGI